MEELTKHYLISGRVQGVGFRAFTRRQASELSLRGWVRNLDDGRVEAMACGPGEILSEFERRLRRGPPAGTVDTLTCTDWKAGEAFAGFEVRKDGRKPCSES